MTIHNQEVKLTGQEALDQVIQQVMKYLDKNRNTQHEKNLVQSSFHIKNKLAHMASHLANPKTKAEKDYSNIVLGTLMSTFRWSIEYMYHKSQVDMSSFTEEDSLIGLLPHIRGNILGPDAIQVGLQELLRLQDIPKATDDRIVSMVWAPKIDYNKIRKAINEQFWFDK